MTDREFTIVKAILNALHDLNGGQLTEPLLHAATNLKIKPAPAASLLEFNAAVNLVDTNGWVTAMQSRFGGAKRNINDAGEAARLEMQ